MSRKKRRRQSDAALADPDMESKRRFLEAHNHARELTVLEQAVASERDRRVAESMMLNGQEFVNRFDYIPVGYGFEGGASALGMSPMFRSDTHGRYQGQDWPFILNDMDVSYARGMARFVTTVQCPALGIKENLLNYIIGEGPVISVEGERHCEVPKGLVPFVQDIIDEFLEENHFPCDLDRELFWRACRDGEFFLAFYPRRDGFTRVRVVEPELVIDPGGAPWSEDQLWSQFGTLVEVANNWRFGVHTADHDVEQVFGYCVQWDPQDTYDYIPEAYMEHHKNADMDRTIKRGLTDFYPAWKWLNSQSRLLANTAEGATELAAISYIIQHAQSSAGQVASMRQSRADASYTVTNSLGNTKQFDKEYRPPGSKLDVPRGQEYLAGPAGHERGNAFLAVVQGILRQVGTRFCMAEGMISGDDSNANMASSVEAGSRFHQFATARQGMMRQRMMRIVRKMLLFAYNQGIFRRFGYYKAGGMTFRELNRVLSIQVEYPDVDPKRAKENTDRRVMLHKEHIMSAKSIQLQEKLDPEEEEANFSKEPQPGGGPGGPGGGAMPGMGGPAEPGSPPDGGNDKPPAPHNPSSGVPKVPEVPKTPPVQKTPQTPQIQKTPELPKVADAQPKAETAAPRVQMRVSESGSSDGAKKGWDTRKTGGETPRLADTQAISPGLKEYQAGMGHVLGVDLTKEPHTDRKWLLKTGKVTGKEATERVRKHFEGQGYLVDVKEPMRFADGTEGDYTVSLYAGKHTRVQVPPKATAESCVVESKSAEWAARAYEAEVEQHLRDTVIAVDLDKTLAEGQETFDQNAIPPPREDAREAMQFLKDRGYTLVINSCRGNTILIQEWLDKHKIPYDHVNRNPDQPAGCSNKVMASAYLDDRAVDASGPLMDAVEKVVEKVEGQAKAHQYATVLIPVKHDALAEMQSRIPDSVLTDDGREGNYHVTCIFGLHDEDHEAAAKILDGIGPISLKLGETSIFPSTEDHPFDVVKVDVESPELEHIHNLLKDKLPNTQTNDKFRPHLTLAYVLPGTGHRFEGMDELEGHEFNADQVVFSDKSRKHTYLPLVQKHHEQCGCPNCGCGAHASDSDWGQSVLDGSLQIMFGVAESDATGPNRTLFGHGEHAEDAENHADSPDIQSHPDISADAVLESALSLLEAGDDPDNVTVADDWSDHVVARASDLLNV